MNKKLTIASTIGLLLVFPVAALAVPGVFQGDVITLVGGVKDLVLNIMWLVAITYIIIMFVLAGFKFMAAQGDPSGVREARQAVIWGIVGTAVILLAWSIISIVAAQLGV